MNKKFVKKVDKIIEFLENNNIKFDNNDNNPLLLLKRLKNINDIYDRNEIIDKIENIVTDLFKNEIKK